MTAPHSDEHAGWQIGQSIALEIDTALSAIGGFFPSAELPAEIGAFVRGLPADWRAQWDGFLSGQQGFVSLIGLAARFAGVLFEPDYERASAAIRELTVAGALRQQAEQARPFGLEADPALPPAERLIDLTTRVAAATYAALGLAPTPERLRGQTPGIALAARILRDGDLHSRFWHWIDRFYYESYRPWRAARATLVAAQEQRAAAALGAPARASAPPALGWLPHQSPLLRYPELNAAVAAGRLRVFFWAEPFEMSDTWALLPDTLVISFAAPGPLYQNFQSFAADLAGRARALSDPTRLTILRIIRHFGMVNTEMADYLDLARPTVSIHAKILREAGLIRSRQEGRLVRHEIVPSEVRRLIRDLERFLDLPEE